MANDTTYLPDTRIGGAPHDPRLLSHRSGLPNYTDAGSALDDALANRSHEFSPDEILGYVASIPPDEPDQHFSYSNTNYILLGQLIEELDGTDLNTSAATSLGTRRSGRSRPRD